MKQPGTGIGWRQPHYQQLMQERPSLGFIEVHSENFFAEGGAARQLLRSAREHYALSLHGVGLSLGSASGLDPWHLEQLRCLVEELQPVRVSDHASFARAQLGGQVVHGNDLLPIAFTDASLAVLQRNVQTAQQVLRRPLLIENISTYLAWEAPGASLRAEPEFFNALCADTGCGLLLDVNNLMVNALNAGLDGAAATEACCHWIEALRPGIVGQIHLAGYCQLEDIVIDDHGSRVRDAVWAVFAHARRQLGPVPALIEWDTDLPPLSVLLDEAAKAEAIQHPGAVEAPTTVEAAHA